MSWLYVCLPGCLPCGAILTRSRLQAIKLLLWNKGKEVLRSAAGLVSDKSLFSFLPFPGCSRWHWSSLNLTPSLRFEGVSHPSLTASLQRSVCFQIHVYTLQIRARQNWGLQVQQLFIQANDVWTAALREPADHRGSAQSCSELVRAPFITAVKTQPCICSAAPPTTHCSVWAAHETCSSLWTVWTSLFNVSACGLCLCSQLAQTVCQARERLNSDCTAATPVSSREVELWLPEATCRWFIKTHCGIAPRHGNKSQAVCSHGCGGVMKRFSVYMCMVLIPDDTSEEEYQFDACVKMRDVLHLDEFYFRMTNN